MWLKDRVRSTGGTLLDQGVVSLGTFAANLAIARTLSPTEYGTFSLLVLTSLWLQVVTSSLLFYPLGVRGTLLGPRERAHLFGTGLVLLLGMCLVATLALVGVLLILHRPDLMLPTIAWFTLWQLQELFRRGLFAEMRHASAIFGDAIAYLGRGATLILLAHYQALTLDNALLAMAGTSAAAFALQSLQFRIARPWLGTELQVLRLCWRIGGFSLGSSLLASAPSQILPWVLAASGGAALTASYQASANLIQLANPIILGLCNVIPQAAARQQAKGESREAWREARSFGRLGALPVLGYFGLLVGLPRYALSAFYGSASPYVHFGLVVQLLAAAAAISYGADMVCSYLHGIERARLAAVINLRGLAVCLAVAVPLAFLSTLTGCGIGMIAIAVARLAGARLILSRTVASDARLRA